MSFTSRTYLLNHYKVCDEFMEIAKIIAKEICPALDCTKRFEKNSELMDHIRTCPLILKDIPTIPEISISNEDTQKEYSCVADGCEEKYETSTELFKHFHKCSIFIGLHNITADF